MSERSYGQIWPIGEDGKPLERTPMTNDAERVSDIKTAINLEFQSLYDEGMRSGKHGHYETMFGAMHQAYAPYIEAQSKALAEAREKLKPFAAVAADYIECGMDHDESVMCGRIPRQGSPQPPVVTFADLRRTLTPTPENPNG